MNTCRRILSTAALGAVAISLAACEPDEEFGANAAMALADGAFQPGWSMSDLAGIDPAFLGGSGMPAYPEALPMQASWDGDYQQAPMFDYAPDYADGYYQPLDEGYYYAGDAGGYGDDSGGLGDIALLALAAALGGMLGQSPPDYGFDYYDGVQPWGWTTADRYVRYAEPVYGGYRYYYYEPDTYRPFYVQDPYYGYGYRDDRLVVIYDGDGRRIDARRADRQRLAARTYFARGEQLYRTGEDAQRYGVPAALWDRHRKTVARDNKQWAKARAKRPVWREWERNEGIERHRAWAEEALLRRGAERRFSDWQQASYRTETPRFYTPEQRRVQLRKVAEIRQREGKADRKREVQAQQVQLAARQERAAGWAGRPQKVEKVAFARQAEPQRLLSPAKQQVRQQLRPEAPRKAQARPDRGVQQREARLVRAEQQRQQHQQVARGEQRRGKQADQQKQLASQQRQARAEQQRQQRAQKQAVRADQQRAQQQASRAEKQRQDRAQQQAARADSERQQQAVRAEAQRQQRAQQQAQATQQRQQQAEAQRQKRAQQQAQAAQQRQQQQAQQKPQAAQKREQQLAQQKAQAAQQRQQQQAQAALQRQQQAEAQRQQREQQAQAERQQRQQQAQAERQQRQQQAQAERQQRQQAQAAQAPAASTDGQRGNGKQRGRDKG